MSKRPQQSPGREDILAAALREFADHGYDGASTVRIAKAAGITQPLVHHHFGNKQGLWSAVIGDVFGELETVLGRAMEEVAGADRRTRLAHLLRTLLAFVGRRPEMSRLTLFESTAGGAPFEELNTRWGRSLIALCRTEVDAAIKDGVLRPVDPDLVYLLIVGACVRPFSELLSVQRELGVDMRDEAFVSRYADLAVDVLLRGLADPAPPPAREPSRKRRR